MFDMFCCPVCKGELLQKLQNYACLSCERNYPIVNSIPNFYIDESGHDFSSDPNIIWLDPKIVEARETVYRLCSRELQGMTFCMGEIAKRTSKGCRLLEVGMGTGHFTRWLAEVSAPGTAIYAFDFSWPIIEKARTNIGENPDVTLLRANAREGLPFQPGFFDIVYIRLAPLGASGVPNVQAAFDLLKPGGWYFWAGWEKDKFETPPTEWAIQHGYESAEFHAWQYQRTQSQEEHSAWQIEFGHLLAMAEKFKKIDTSKEASFDPVSDQVSNGGVLRMIQEHVMIAQKPGR
jgi:SAM-dependent methyltransferase